MNCLGGRLYIEANRASRSRRVLIHPTGGRRFRYNIIPVDPRFGNALVKLIV